MGQTFVISKMQKLSKEGLQRTDKRIGLMNEILAAMDTVKYCSVHNDNFHSDYMKTGSDQADSILFEIVCRCYAWEQSFQSKVQDIRNDELSWFRKAQLLAAVY